MAWSAPIAYYRLYFLSPDDHISRFVELFHDTDQQAIADARGRSTEQAMELWSRERFVMRIPSGGTIAAEVGHAVAAAHVPPA